MFGFTTSDYPFGIGWWIENIYESLRKGKRSAYVMAKGGEGNSNNYLTVKLRLP
jgi:hypothetical protein